MMLVIVRVGVVVMAALMLQLELFSDTRFFGVMPEMLLGAAIAAGWAGGPERGAMVGFCLGLLYDLFLPTPFGLTAMTYVMVATAVGVVATVAADAGENLLRRFVSLGALAVGITLFVMMGELLSQPNLYTDRFATVLVLATLYTAPFMPLLHFSMRWAFGVHADDAPTPVRLSMVE